MYNRRTLGLYSFIFFLLAIRNRTRNSETVTGLPDLPRTVLEARRKLAQDYLGNRKAVINKWVHVGLSQERRRECLPHGINHDVGGTLLDYNDKVNNVPA